MRLRFLLTALIFILLPSISLLAQDSSHISWTATSVKTAPGKFDVILKGQVKAGWHLYAKPDATVGLAGVVVKVQDESVNADTIIFISALEDYKDPIFENSNQNVARENVEIKMAINVGAQVPDAVKLQVTYDVAQKDNFIPEEQSLTVKLEGGVAVKVDDKVIIPSINLDKPANETIIVSSGSNDAKSKGLGGIFVLGFLGGLDALLTPCVFPMIPLTVSFFTKKDFRGDLLSSLHPLGASVVNADGTRDGGELFALACGVWLSAALLLWMSRDTIGRILVRKG